MRPSLAVMLFSVGLAGLPFRACGQVNVVTHHNDNARTGANTSETILTPGNVGTNTFGKLFSYSVDGYVYTQPLYVANVAIPGKGTHNVVFIGTENDSVYAFDADSNAGSNSAPLWQSSFINPAAGITPLNTTDAGTTDITPLIGITGTPVIDPVAGTLFVIVKTKEVSGTTTNFVQRLHALDITTGVDRPNSPVVVGPSAPSINPAAYNYSNGKVNFNVRAQNQRCGLLLLNGVVYVAWASHGDGGTYHGWLVGYDENTLQQTAVFNSSPNGIQAGIWQGGGGPAADASGNVFLITGNGTYDATNDYGDSFVKLTPSGTNLNVADYFTPYNQATLAANDTDLGAGGAVILPDSVGSAAHPHLIVGAGKQGTIYLVDRDNMGHYNSTTSNDNQIVQSLVSAVGVNLNVPAYFNNRIYYRAYNDYLKIFLITNGLLSATPIASGGPLAGLFGSTPSISANGTNNAIVWFIDYAGYKTNGQSILHAFNAYNLTTELYNSSQAGNRDLPGAAVKFSVPTVVNGKVYVGTETSLTVFGNAAFTSSPIITSQPQSQTVGLGAAVSFSASVSSSNSFGCQWLFNGNPIYWAVGTNFSIGAAQLTDAGGYSLIVSNISGSSVSATAYLSVVAPLTNTPGSILAPYGLVNWYPADGNALDIFGGSNAAPQGGLDYAAGESGLAFKFDGTSAFLILGATNLPPPWSACFWVNRNNGLTNSTVLLGDNTYSLKLEQFNGTHAVGFSQLTVKDYLFNPSYTVPVATWTHLAFVATVSNVSLYANGVFQGSTNVSNFPLPRSYIGASYATSRFIDYLDGELDEILLFNRALAGSEVAGIYAAGSAGLIRAPRFASASVSNGQFNLNLIGQTGKTFTLYSSTNLVNWQTLATIPNPTGTASFNAPGSTSGAQMFYRATQP